MINPKTQNWRPAWLQRMKGWWGLSRVSDLPSPVVLWRGPSQLDPAVEVMAAACVTSPKRSKNGKTGDMIQVAIFRTDMPPVQAWSQGLDGPVCPGSCIHKSKARGGGGTCYVNKGRLRAAWGAAVSQPVFPKNSLPVFGQGALLRLGMEGDPSAVPFDIWELLVRDSMGWSGYTAHWRELGEKWPSLFMASCASSAEADEAEIRGWRTFSSSSSVREDQAHEAAGRRVCHAEAHKLTCGECRGCDGLARGKRRPSFHLPLHGPVGAAVRRRSGQLKLFAQAAPKV